MSPLTFILLLNRAPTSSKQPFSCCFFFSQASVVLIVDWSMYMYSLALAKDLSTKVVSLRTGEEDQTWPNEDVLTRALCFQSDPHQMLPSPTPKEL